MANLLNDEQKSTNRTLRKLYIAAGGFIVLCGLFIFANSQSDNGHSMFWDRPTNEAKTDKGDTYMENDSDKQEKVEIGMNKEAATKALEELQNNKEVQKNASPDLLRVNGQYFYIFDKDMLLPVATDEWIQYDIPGASNGTYSKISEYYLTDESPAAWTQKFSIHQIQTEDKDCYAMAEKVIHGLLLNLTAQMEEVGLTLSKDNTAFTYVKKDPNDTLFYWEQKNIEGATDQTQFARIFLSEYSKKMYLATFTLKDSASQMTEQELITQLKNLQSAQELKRNSATHD